MKIDISADVGESFGRYRIGNDEELIPLLSSVNIACGWHAGDPMVMRKTILLAKKHGVGIGFHAGFLDQMGFGRRDMDISPEEMKNYIIYQMGALIAFAKAEGVKLQHATVHGAAGHICAGKKEYAKAFIEAVMEVEPSLFIPTFYGSRGQVIADEAKNRGVRWVPRWFFADRAYTRDYNLASRKIPGTVIHDLKEIVARTMRMIKEKKVKTVDGIDIDMAADSIMVHGDEAGTVEIVKALRKGLEAEGIKIVPMAELV
jgi:UPF0271 protein